MVVHVVTIPTIILLDITTHTIGPEMWSYQSAVEVMEVTSLLLLGGCPEKALEQDGGLPSHHPILELCLEAVRPRGGGGGAGAGESMVVVSERN